ncbi:hypothetical protein GA0111570_10193 [Raineyella antarctica]|uniref:Uncharacterized protein n=1 Tax=Raineyella antarctica TaxID=1577474 RepID=A0A1G6GCY0_9ACTN|nr:hypothetical protein [Raineyella antarctica]SDB79824.1 hypothetical protein GA0111570_10193 [Raineyella antarctica]
MAASTPGAGLTPPGDGVVRASGWSRPRWLRHRWLRHLVGLAVLLGVLMVVARPVQVTPVPVSTSRLVVIGVGERGELGPVDRTVLESRSTSSAYGVVATDRNIGECVSAAWLSLGTGRLASTGAECEPQVTLSPGVRLGGVGGAAVTNWQQLASINSALTLDLGRNERRLADATEPTGDRCILAVGPGAALAAADRDGTVQRYSDLAAWQAGGYPTDCRVTIVDAAVSSGEAIRHLVDAQRATVVVVGLGPAGPLVRDSGGVPRADKLKLSSVQAAYRVDPDGTARAGALSSETTREPGVITLSDVSAAIADVLGGQDAMVGPTRAASLGVVPGPVSAQRAADLLRTVSVLQDRRPILLAHGGVLVALLLVSAVMVLRRAWRHAPILGAALTTWPIALLSAGAVPWYAAHRPVLAGIAVVLAAWLVATVLARLLTTPRRPAGIAGAALVLAATAASAALGDAWQWGTLLDSTTALGPDWVGIGPGAAAICVGSALSIAAWWADRLPKRDSVIAIVALVVLCGIVLLPNVTYAVALLCGGVVLTFADTARSWVRAAIPWADPLFAGNSVATLVAALVGTALLFVDSGTILLRAAPETPIFGGLMMGWLGCVTLAIWLEIRAAAWFTARDAGQLPAPTSL